VIVLTRPNGQPVMLNCDLIESVEQNGEPMDEVERRVVDFKRKIYGLQQPRT
jgi:uncharacterized protein YlzI (FlbEa/FlbD family)